MGVFTPVFQFIHQFIQEPQKWFLWMNSHQIRFVIRDESNSSLVWMGLKNPTPTNYFLAISWPRSQLWRDLGLSGWLWMFCDFTFGSPHPTLLLFVGHFKGCLSPEHLFNSRNFGRSRTVWLEVLWLLVSSDSRKQNAFTEAISFPRKLLMKNISFPWFSTKWKNWSHVLTILHICLAFRSVSFGFGVDLMLLCMLTMIWISSSLTLWNEQ